MVITMILCDNDSTVGRSEERQNRFFHANRVKMVPSFRRLIHDELHANGESGLAQSGLTLGPKEP